MLVARIYGLIWLIAAAAGAILFFTNSFSPAASIVFGFIVSVLTGAALLVVFPAVMTERHSPAQAARKTGKL